MWWQAMFETVLDGILVFDSERRYVDANPAACTLLLLDRQAIVGRPTDEIFSVPISQEKWDAFFRTGRSFGEYEFRRSDGEIRTIEYRALAHFWEQLHMVSLRDVTVERQAVAELRRQKELLQTIVDHIPVMINFIDEEGRVQWSNREWERVLGWTLEEARHHDVLGAIYPDEKERAIAFSTIKEASGAWRDFHGYRKDGTPIDTTWANVRLSDGTLIGIGQDITQRKRVEAQLQASRERLRQLVQRAHQRSERERREIARELHDQVGQVLTGLKMDALWIAEHAPQSDTREKAVHMTASVDGAIQLVRRLASDLRPIALDRLGLIEALELQAEEFERKSGVRCRLTSRAERLNLTPEQATQVFRIVQEAMTNTARHAAATRVNIEAWTSKTTFVVEVRDNGAGIADAAMRDDASLGLLGMRERARLIGGDLTISRGDRRGTVVTLTLPLPVDGPHGATVTLPEHIGRP
jgi:PAS domain S-box-containing protein